MLASILEFDSRPGDEVFDGGGDEDLSGVRLGGYATLQAWTMALLAGGMLVGVAACIAFGVGARVRRHELAELVAVTTLGVMAISEIAAAMR